LTEFRTLGIVLRHSNYGEADRILRILTADFGLISAIAKGVRKIKSKKAGTLQSFRVSELRLHRRTGELFLVTGATPADKFEIAELPQLAVAYSLAEWLLALIPAEKPLPEAFALVQESLKNLAASPKHDLIQLTFQAKLLDLLGFLPEFSSAAKEEKLLRFLQAADFSVILRLEDDPVIFQKSADLLAKVYAAIHDRPSRVEPATQDWK
jgi:DNA repair protein RecO (recombination protein O)